MAEEQREILWKPDADLPHDDLARRPSTRFQLCDLCRKVLTSPETIQPSYYGTSGVSLCGGTLQETQCSLRAMLLHYLCLPGKKDWPDFESMNGVLTSRLSLEGFNSTVLNLHGGWPNETIWEYSERLQFHLQAYLDDPAAEIITSRPFIEDLGSREAFEQMNHWIKECDQSHLGCGNDSATTTSLPCRVIDVQSLKLHQSFDGEVGQYAALTYCWGRETIPGALVEANQQALKENIRLDSLPQTVKDAIFVTRNLGLKYVWIDAYCIIQDSIQDKNKELSRMGEIYSQAYVTLSASNAWTVLDGFLSKRQPRPRSITERYKFPRLLVPFRIPNAEGVMGTAILQEGDGRNLNLNPIMYRSWTFQERLLSRRILIFGAHELSWQCNGAQRSCGAFDETGDFGRPAFLSRENHLKEKDFEYEWMSLVQQYSRRDITHEEDTLVALAGVASRFADAQGSKDVYLAGLWRSKIPAELVWRTSGFEMLRPSVYVAPSWSWASTKGPGGVTWPQGYEQAHRYVEIIDCETTLKISDLPYGQVTGGRLRLRGRFRPALQPQSTVFPKHEQCTLTTASPSTYASAGSKRCKQETHMHKWEQELKGHVKWDTESEPHDPRLVFYLRLTDQCGLALIREHPGVFRRVGLCWSMNKMDVDEYCATSNLKDIEII